MQNINTSETIYLSLSNNPEYLQTSVGNGPVGERSISENLSLFILIWNFFRA